MQNDNDKNVKLKYQSEKLKISFARIISIFPLLFSVGLFLYFVSIVPAKAATTATFNVAAGADDGFIYGASSFVNNNTSWDFGAFVDPVDYNNVFARFTSVNIPNGSTINTAYLTVTSRANTTDDNVQLKVNVENTDDAVAPTSFSDYNDKVT